LHFLRNGGKQLVGFRIRERQQSQFLLSIKSGDEPRRPPAELSFVIEEQHWAREVLGCVQ
jgi:hypothetical protein